MEKVRLAIRKIQNSTRPEIAGLSIGMWGSAAASTPQLAMCSHANRIVICFCDQRRISSGKATS
jgi:hypothetical protein